MVLGGIYAADRRLPVNRRVSHQFITLTYGECKVLKRGERIGFFSTRDHLVHKMKVTSVKTWKRTDKIELHWKYGLRDFGYQAMYPTVPQDKVSGASGYFVREVDLTNPNDVGELNKIYEEGLYVSP